MKAAGKVFPNSPFTLLSRKGFSFLFRCQSKPNFKSIAIAALIALLTLTVAAAIAIQGVSAQTAPRIPEFTLKTRTTPEGAAIVLTIQNQPYDAASYPNDGFFYNVRIRTSGGNWTELYTAEDWYPQQAGDQTVLNFTAGENAYWPRETSQGHPAIPASGKVEFEVQAMNGHRDRGSLEPGTMILPYVFVGVTSDWSPSQAVTVGNSASASLTPAANLGGKSDIVSWMVVAVMVLAVAVLFVVAFVVVRRRIWSAGAQKH